MKSLIDFLIKNERWLFVVFLFSLIFCLLQTVIFSDIPELFKYGAKLGDYLSAICYSYIASYVFYFVALRIDRTNKKSYHRNAISKIEKIIGNFETILDLMSKQAGLPYRTKSEIETLLEAINPKGKAIDYTTIDYNNKKIVHKYYNWAEYIVENNKKIKDLYTQFLPFITVIDIKIIDKLNDIMDSSYFYGFHNILVDINYMSNTNLSFMSDVFSEMAEKMKSLKTIVLEIKASYHI